MQNTFKNRLRTASLTTSVAISMALISTAALAGQVPGPLVDVAWLDANKGDVLILDVQKKQDLFTKRGHIPGSIFVDWGKVRTKKTVDGVEYIGMLPSAASFGRFMKTLGANKDSEIIISTAGLNSPQVFFGTRLYWQLKYYGHDNVALLDGGDAAWAAAKKPVSHDVTKASVGNWAATAERKEILASTSDMVAMVKAGSDNMFDARTLDYHLGLEQKKKYVYKNGHIPGSKVVPHNILVSHKGPATFRTVEQLKGTLVAMGAKLDETNVTYCNSGHLASGLWFVMHELAGDKNVKVYDGSMHAWTKDKSHPVTKYNLN